METHNWSPGVSTKNDNKQEIIKISNFDVNDHVGTIQRSWAPSQYPKRRLSVKSRKVSKPRDLYLELSDRSEIWQALRQQCCRCACQISKRYDNLKYQSRGFETLRDLTERRLFGYWDGAQMAIGHGTLDSMLEYNPFLCTFCQLENSYFCNFSLV